MKKKNWKKQTSIFLMGVLVAGMTSNIYGAENVEKESGIIENSAEINDNEQDVQEKNLEVAEKKDAADSWRYENGELRNIEKPVSKKARNLARTVTPWTNINGSFYNSLGQKIEGVVAKGIDVSEHNGTIDWNKLKKTDVDYAIIRCGYGMNQTNQDDKKWSYNTSECEKAGIPYGVYLYSYADSTQKAVSEAEHVLRLIKGKKLSYPIYYDLEEQKVRDKISESEIAKIAKAFCDTIESSGYDVGIYANTDWFTGYLKDPVFNNYKKWVAQYNYKCTYSGSYTMWQCTSKGSVNGITGNVDLNMDFGTSGDVNGKILVKSNGETYCYQKGEKLYGEQNVNDKWYYFDEKTGEMQTGIYNLGNKVVYYGTDGAMRYGEQNVNDKWYYFDTRTGGMQTGIYNLGNKVVYYGTDGAMRYGEQNINDKWYYFDTRTGAMQYGEKCIDGKWYYFDTRTGEMQTGIYNLGNKVVYYGTDGAMRYGEQNVNDKWYYFDTRTGGMQTGIYNLGNKVVYYGTDGAMRYGEQNINGKWYYFNESNGIMQIGFCDLGNKVVYYDADGTMQYGEKCISGKWYYFDKRTGAMQIGFCDLGNKIVYYGTDGAMRYGEQNINGKLYYFDERTGAMKNNW